MRLPRFSFRPPSVSTFGLIALLIAAALSISACGNKGPLTHPAAKPATTR